MQPGRHSTVLPWRCWWEGKCRVSDTADSPALLSAATPSVGAAERVGPIIIEHREQQCLGAMGLIYPGAFRGGRTKCGAFPTPSPHNLRHAKSAGGEGVASGSESRIKRK
jgi:hypothetical protein